MSSFPRQVRLHARRDFLRAFRRGRRIASVYFRCHFVRHDSASRLGIVVARNVGSAVVRNRLRRLVRDAFRHCRTTIPSGDRVVVVLPAAAAAANDLLRHELTRLLQSAK